MTPEEKCRRIDELLNRPISEAGPIINILNEISDIMGRKVLFHELGHPDVLKDEVGQGSNKKSKLVVVSERVSTLDK